MAVVSATRIQRSPEHYRAKCQKHREKPVKRRHADTTKINMNGVKKKWEQHCLYLGVACPYDYLKNSSKEHVITFLEWMLDTYPRIRKRSSVLAYKRILFQVHHKSVGHDFNESANKEIIDYINGFLTINYELDTSMKEKPVMNVDDVYLVLHHHFVHDTSTFPDERQRLQLALLILLQSYTATRPRVLVYKRLSKAKIQDHYFGWEEETIEVDFATEWDPEEDDFKTMTYGDVNLFLLKNEDGMRDLPAIEVTLRFTKGWERREIPKTFIFYEVNNLLFNAIILMITLGLLD